MSRRHLSIGGVAVVLCLACMILAFIVWPMPVASPLLFLSGAFYGLAMGMAMKYANEKKVKDDENH